MLHKAWNSKGEMPYCFARSSIKFQGHTGQNITDFDPNWAFPYYRPVAAFKSLRFALLFFLIFIYLFIYLFILFYFYFYFYFILFFFFWGGGGLEHAVLCNEYGQSTGSKPSCREYCPCCLQQWCAILSLCKYWHRGETAYYRRWVLSLGISTTSLGRLFHGVMGTAINFSYKYHRSLEISSPIIDFFIIRCCKIYLWYPLRNDMQFPKQCKNFISIIKFGCRRLRSDTVDEINHMSQQLYQYGVITHVAYDTCTPHLLTLVNLSLSIVSHVTEDIVQAIRLEKVFLPEFRTNMRKPKARTMVG